MKKSLKIIGCLLALLVPARCLAVKKNWLMVLIGCCFGDSCAEIGGPSTVYEVPKNDFENDVDTFEQKTQDEVFVSLGDLLDAHVKKSNGLVNRYLKQEDT